MRVISGSCKGRPLKAVPGTTTRPTTDKIKESIFNIIGPYFNGGLALDLYGGSGGLGIEALSRGIEKAVFVDREQKAIETIKLNLESCGYSAQSEVYRNDAQRALKALYKREAVFDLIFLDPPYAKQMLKKDLLKVDEYSMLAEDGIIIAEHDPQVTLPEETERLIRFKYDKYGTATAVSFYKYK
ncbi:16S rRNA (guanine(966)-N(2))-methyltransferase RsmD [Fictibacillus iocasae]|uniref:16S rRNA (Guanine(966)-N(2))-methyltransferase RsmD n=1 Tax=Fictibacillus iocasae TaxID=2715437 RepID=A0ABW2NST2_9BACL